MNKDSTKATAAAVDLERGQERNARQSGAESVVHDSEEPAKYGAGFNEPEQPADADESRTPEESIDLGQLLTGLKHEMTALRNEHEREKAVSAEYLRRLQQLQADYDNFRKRTQREKEELAKYAAEKIVTDLLPVLDNLERGLYASRSSQDFEGLAKGVEMILRQLASLLEREGLTTIAAVGQGFDPAVHEAVMRVEADGFEPNIVVEELQKGYLLKDKVLRPSMVKVSQ